MYRVKYVFLLFLASFMSITLNPEVLTASDSIKIGDLDQSKLVETIIPEIPEVAEEPVVIERIIPVVRTAYIQPETRIPDNYIRIGGKTIEVVGVSTTGAEAGNHVNYIGKLLYGHNSAAVFGHLENLGIGETFTVVYEGATTNYVITGSDLFEKNLETGRLQLGGSGNYMTSIKNNARGHDLALMTCAGTMLGGGDATHRLVVYADRQ